MIHTKSVFALAVGVILLTGPAGCENNSTDKILGAIEKLASDDFLIARKAQLTLLGHGTNAVPQLLGAIEHPRNGKQLALAVYMVGEIDASSYLAALERFSRPGHSKESLCDILKYPNVEALKKCKKHELAQLVSGFKKLMASNGLNSKEIIQVQDFLLAVDEVRQH